MCVAKFYPPIFLFSIMDFADSRSDTAIIFLLHQIAGIQNSTDFVW
jgi:hypothetical protein